jgi:aspartyl-tRNA(Asn)/glutamyl-tRNA(Gln) amidotransferase subunit A
VDADGLQALEAARKVLEAQGAEVFSMAVDLPDISEVFSKIWGAALARQVGTIPPEKRGLLDAGLLGVALRFQNVSALDMLEAEALRVRAAHAMATQDYDALICPCVPQCAPLADAKVEDPVGALWQNWAPWTFLFNLTRQPALSLPMGLNGAGLPVAVQIAAPMYEDARVLRVGRAIEKEVAFLKKPERPPGRQNTFVSTMWREPSVG